MRRSTLVVAAVAAFLAATGEASAEPAFLGVRAATSTKASALTLRRPTDSGKGDVLVAALDVRLPSGTTVTAPSGWTLVRRTNGSSPALGQLVFVKVAGRKEPSSYKWRFAKSTSTAGALAAYGGVDPLFPVVGSAGRVAGSASPQRVTAPSVSGALSGDLVLAVYGTSGRPTISAPADLRERFDVRTGKKAARTISLAGADAIQEFDGATGERTATASTSNGTNIGQLVVLRAAASLPAPPPPPDFRLSLSVDSLSARQGTTATDSVSVTALDNFAETVTFSTSGLPTGGSAVFTPQAVPGGGNAELQLSTSPSTPTGSYLLTVTGTSGSLVRSAQLTLIVEPAAAPPVPPVGTALPPRLADSTGSTFYVAPAGSDSNPGTAAAPWRTIQKALNTLSAGQTALVRGGIYVQSLVATHGGTAAAPITIRAYPGEMPVLRPGSGQTNNMPLQLGSGAAYLRFQGLTFEGATGPSTTDVYAWGTAHDIELSDCEVRNSARQGFFSEATTSSIHILACFFHDNGGSGPTQLDHNLYLQGSRHLVASSLVTNARNGFGIQIYPSSSGTIVAENTIVGNMRDGIIIGSEGSTTTTSTVVVNNVLAFNGRYGISTYWGGATGAGNVATNNLAWGNAAGDFTGSGISYSANVVANPLFLDRSGGDYRLEATSPAVDAARAEYSLPTDIAGAVRPQGGGADLSAYER